MHGGIALLKKQTNVLIYSYLHYIHWFLKRPLLTENVWPVRGLKKNLHIFSLDL